MSGITTRTSLVSFGGVVARILSPPIAELTVDVREFLNGLGSCSAVEAAAVLEEQMGVRLHPRSIQRARQR